jgi:hypothetical protein
MYVEMVSCGAERQMTAFQLPIPCKGWCKLFTNHSSLTHESQRLLRIIRISYYGWHDMLQLLPLGVVGHAKQDALLQSRDVCLSAAHTALVPMFAANCTAGYWCG